MSLTGVALSRVKKELEMLYTDPPPGISAWLAHEDDAREIEAVIEGAAETPYAHGRFRLRVTMPQRYPFEPPKVHYVTPIYHPNIDSAGRICLDILNMPPKGAWKPSLNISTVLQSLQLLMSEPNPDDGLMVDITHQYIHDHARFQAIAIERTRLHAMGTPAGADGVADASATSTDGSASGALADCSAAPAAAPAPSIASNAAAAAPETGMTQLAPSTAPATEGGAAVVVHPVTTTTRPRDAASDAAGSTHSTDGADAKRLKAA